MTSTFAPSPANARIGASVRVGTRTPTVVLALAAMQTITTDASRSPAQGPPELH